MGARFLGLGFLRGRDDALGDGLDDLLVDFVDGEVALDEDDAVGLAGGDFAVLFPDAAEEGVLLRLEAVFVAAGFSFDRGSLRRRARASDDSKPGRSRRVRSGCKPPQMRRCRSRTT